MTTTLGPGGYPISVGEVTAVLAVTEAPDTVSLTGAEAVTGTLAVTEADDVFAGEGEVVPGGTVIGNLAFTETPDFFSGRGRVVDNSPQVDEGGSPIGGEHAVDRIIFSDWWIRQRIGARIQITESPDTISMSGTVQPQKREIEFLVEAPKPVVDQPPYLITDRAVPDRFETSITIADPVRRQTIEMRVSEAPDIANMVAATRDTEAEILALLIAA